MKMLQKEYRAALFEVMDIQYQRQVGFRARDVYFQRWKSIKVEIATQKAIKKVSLTSHQNWLSKFGKLCLW